MILKQIIEAVENLGMPVRYYAITCQAGYVVCIVAAPANWLPGKIEDGAQCHRISPAYYTYMKEHNFCEVRPLLGMFWECQNHQAPPSEEPFSPEPSTLPVWTRERDI